VYFSLRVQTFILYLDFVFLLKTDTTWGYFGYKYRTAICRWLRL